MIKCRGRTSKIIILKSYTAMPVNEEGNDEYINPNPTYEDVHKPADVDVSPNPTFQDIQGDKTIDISPNPNFQDAEDNEFSVRLEN